MNRSLEDRLELRFLIAAQLIHLAIFYPLLSGQTTLVHDNIVWNYPTFAYYFSQLSQGHLPIFNFFSRFGEPFVPLGAQMRFWDPLQTLLGLGLWNFLPDAVTAFNWFHYLVGLIQSWGIFLFLRPYGRAVWIRMVILLVVLFGSPFLGAFRQDGILNQFLWIPFIAWILRERFIRNEPTFVSALWLGLLLGSSFQSYFFVPPFLFVFAYLGFSWMSVERMAGANRRSLPKVATAFVPLILMSGLNLAIYAQAKDWVFPARSTPESLETTDFYRFDAARLERAKVETQTIKLDPKVVRMTANNSRYWDYIQMFSPWGNINVSWRREKYYGEPSEAYVYFGLLPLVLGFVGIAVARAREDVVWRNLLLFFFLLGLGLEGGLYQALSWIFPPLSFVRTMHCMTLFTQMAFLYFVIRGGDLIHEKIERVRG